MNAVIARDRTTGAGRQSDTRGNAIDSLVIGKADTPPVATAPEISTELKKAVATWYEAHDNKPGYRSGSSYAPEQMRETIEVSSALQLPKILAKLHGQDASNIRLQFPQPDSSLSEDERTAIRQEQTAIHAFLRASHGKPLNELLNEAKDLIAGSASLEQAKQDKLLPPDMTAEQWIAATVGEKLEQIAKHPQQLAVSDVVEIGSRKIERVKPALELALEESVSSSRGLIVTIPKGRDENKLSELRAVLKTFVEAKKASGFADEQLERIKVWVGPTKTDITKEPEHGSPCKQVREFSLLEFLKGETAAPVSKEKSSVATDAPSAEGATAAVTAESDKKPAAESKEKVPPVAEATVQAAPLDLDNLCFQTLVSPPRDPNWSFNTSEIESQRKNSEGETA